MVTDRRTSGTQLEDQGIEFKATLRVKDAMGAAGHVSLTSYNRVVLITGDLAHFHENYDTNGVPWFNSSRAESLASIDRFKKLAANFKATLIIQHDARDIGLLPAFPAAAK